MLLTSLPQERIINPSDVSSNRCRNREIDLSHAPPTGDHSRRPLCLDLISHYHGLGPCMYVLIGTSGLCNDDPTQSKRKKQKEKRAVHGWVQIQLSFVVQKHSAFCDRSKRILWAEVHGPAYAYCFSRGYVITWCPSLMSTWQIIFSPI